MTEVARTVIQTQLGKFVGGNRVAVSFVVLSCVAEIGERNVQTPDTQLKLGVNPSALDQFPDRLQRAILVQRVPFFFQQPAQSFAAEISPASAFFITPKLSATCFALSHH